MFQFLIPENKLSSIEDSLMWAGYPYSWTSDIYMGVKFISTIIGLMTGLFLIIIGLPFVLLIIITTIAFFIPNIIVRDKVKTRQKDISNNIPNMVGLISIAINAGVELTPAFEAVSYNMPGVLGEELRNALKEISTGKKRSTVLRNIARNTGVSVFERFIDTINTAEERGGINLSEALTEFNYTLRELESKKLQEEARKLPTKMQLPLFLCIFFPMLVIILTPVVFTLMEDL